MAHTTSSSTCIGLTKSFGGRRWCMTCRCRSSAARSTASSGRTARARPPPSACCAACSRPTSGEGTCLGYDIRTEADKIKRQVGYMTQRFSLYEDLSVRENLGIRRPHLRHAEPRVRARASMIERLGLARPRGAARRRTFRRLEAAAGARRLHAADPQLLLLDEPTAGVDPKARRDFWNEIHALAAEGLTVLVSTHYMDEAERCHEIAYIAYRRSAGARHRRAM